MTLQVNTHMGNYPIIIKRNALSYAGEHLRLAGRRVCIVTDTGVPAHYATAIADLCEHPVVFRFPEGEANKTMDTLQDLLRLLLKSGFDRADAIVAVGGGVVTDLAGFAAAIYMRGIDFYNVPTTLLSQVDSSIGGKVAIDLGGYKNIVGAFYQPKCVLIDPETLLTLDIRQIRAGLVEALKMATTSDPVLFEIFESDEYLNDIEEVILRSLLIKKGIVERDVNEKGERKVLNFGHTVGHAIESSTDLIHGEAVAIGMLYMCDESVKTRLLTILDEMGLPLDIEIDAKLLYDFILRDKKADGDFITITYVSEVGKAELRKLPIENIRDYLTNPQNFGGIQ